MSTMEEFGKCINYSLMESLNRDPQATSDGMDHDPRQVFSGHYVPVKPTPISQPRYVAHSQTLFRDLGLDDKLANSEEFKKLFSGDMSAPPAPMKPYGWATGYALSIFGTEYTQQCPFQTGNGYGDGRAISVVEGVFNGKRWEMQLKGGGRTPYCRGADGRAVLRSSIREFLAQEHMHALGVPTSRSLSLFVSDVDTVQRPWYTEGSKSAEPDTMMRDPIAISTRVAPSFLRVGQLELFGRRARKNAHQDAMKELELIVEHLIDREYKDLDFGEETQLSSKCVILAKEFRERLTSLVANWIRVGFCQGNFNSDNCAAGGYTLDYGPFGFCEMFDPNFQPWTGGGRHFAFLNQVAAAEANFKMFCTALEPLVSSDTESKMQLDALLDGFEETMKQKLYLMWAKKLGLNEIEYPFLLQLLGLMTEADVDYTIFFRKLSDVPTDIEQLEPSFYTPLSPELRKKWVSWLEQWRSKIADRNIDDLRLQMKRVNPKFTWREWLVVPAYKSAAPNGVLPGNYSLLHEAHSVLLNPYDEQVGFEQKFFQKRPKEEFLKGGVRCMSCSS